MQLISLQNMTLRARSRRHCYLNRNPPHSTATNSSPAGSEARSFPFLTPYGQEWSGSGEGLRLSQDDMATAADGHGPGRRAAVSRRRRNALKA
jgi:hypothetical protein